jgi:hypothetical protein
LELVVQAVEDGQVRRALKLAVLETHPTQVHHKGIMAVLVQMTVLAVVAVLLLLVEVVLPLIAVLVGLVLHLVFQVHP